MYKKLSSYFFLFIIFFIGIVPDGGARNTEIHTGDYLPLPVTYIYGYNNTVVIAQIVNGQQKEVAFTSFESADQGYWTYGGTTAGSNSDLGRTGTKYYNLGTGAIQRNNLPSGKYVVSYWSKGGGASITGTNYSPVNETSDMTVNSWTYHECVFQLSSTGNIQLSGNVQIDELRLYPFTSQMVTYTYDPLIGKTSETDINNITTYYEYDEFFRLKCVKDQYGNIRKNYIYHLKNQL